MVAYNVKSDTIPFPEGWSPDLFSMILDFPDEERLIVIVPCIKSVIRFSYEVLHAFFNSIYHCGIRKYIEECPSIALGDVVACTHEAWFLIGSTVRQMEDHSDFHKMLYTLGKPSIDLGHNPYFENPEQMKGWLEIHNAKSNGGITNLINDLIGLDEEMDEDLEEFDDINDADWWKEPNE